MGENRQIRTYFETLKQAWGPQHWWPAESGFEVVVGAILTQNTAWTNVEKALANLRNANTISIEAIRRIGLDDLERLVQPAGFFRQKATRLKGFVTWLDERYRGSLDRTFAEPTSKLRAELLGLNGIGPETADSILLYAGQHEVFVVDAYTRRVFERHGLVQTGAEYEQIRRMVESALQDRRAQGGLGRNAKSAALQTRPGPRKETLIPTIHPSSKMSETPRSPLAQDYNEFHALIVQVGKHYCLSREPRCQGCPLRVYLARPVVLPSEGRAQRAKRPPRS